MTDDDEGRANKEAAERLVASLPPLSDAAVAGAARLAAQLDAKIARDETEEKRRVYAENQATTELPMGRRERELRELVDTLWGELPADVARRLDPAVVEACRANHELTAHEEEQS